MKKTSILLITIVCGLQGIAQNNKVTSAIMHLTEYGSKGDTTELYAAKQSIDDASVNDKTKDEPKMYLYRGEVYLTLFNRQLNHIVSNLLKSAAASDKKNVSKLTSQAYGATDTNALCISANSFIKVLQLAPKDSYSDEAKEPQNLQTCLVHLENKALQEYNAQHYTSAIALSQKAILITSLLTMPDSNNKVSYELIANAANKGGNIPVALKYYQKMLDLKYQGASPYSSIATMYLRQKDSANAWVYIEKGRAQFPDDLPLIITETNFYLGKKDYEKATANLTISITKVQQRSDKDKNKLLLASLYTNLGGIYDHKANPRDDKGNDLPKPADYDTLVAKAETNYNNALALTPDNFDLLYNVGALYFNRAVPIAREANDLPLNAKAKYDKMTAEAKAYFLKAEPFFESAYKINPNDVANKNALMQVYNSTDQTDKAEAIGKNK